MKIERLAVCIVLAGCALAVWFSITRGVSGEQLPTFTLSAEPASKVIPWWDFDFNYTISISPTNLPYSVTLSATAPYDVMASFSPRYLIPAISSTLTVDPCGSIVLPFDTWYTVTIDLSKFTFSDGAAWANETIRQYRLYPFGTAKLTADCRAHLEWVGFFADLNEAKDYKGPYYVEPVETTAAAATEAAKPAAAAPQTFDAITLTAAAAVVSLGSALVLRRKSSR